MDGEAFRDYWSTKHDSDHSVRPGVDVFEIAAGEIRAFYDPNRWPRTLEIGCGAGEVFAHLGFSQANYLGVDVSATILEQFRERHPGVTTKLGDAVSFVADTSFDFILINNVVQYMPWSEVRHVISNVRRMLAPGGRALIGNVPDRQLRMRYQRQAFARSRRRLHIRLASFALESVRALLSPGAPTRRLGYWHARKDFAIAAAGEGLSAEFFGCLLYSYRFSAVLQHRDG